MPSNILAIIGAIGSILYAADMIARPPQPKCPKCHLPMYNPGKRYSRCVGCAQLIDWHHKGRKGARRGRA